VRRVPLPADRLPAEFEGADRPDVVALLATRGLGADARRQIASRVSQGGGLLLAIGPGVEAGALAQLFGEEGGVSIEQADAVPLPTTLAPVDVRHPVFAPYADRASAYSGVRFDRIVRLGTAPQDRVLARFENGLAAIVERRVGKGRVLVVASDLDARWNRWPLSATFVPFVAEATRRLAGRDDIVTEYLAGSVPAAIASTPGAHVLADGQRVVVNVDPRESAIDLISAAEVQAAVTHAPGDVVRPEALAAARESSQALWRYVILALLAVLVVEGVVGARRAVFV
jgi:hypothetical protein